MTLHEAIVEILRDMGRSMSTKELASEVNRRGFYRKKDLSPVTAFQIHGRTRNYDRLFLRQGSQVQLLEWNDGIWTSEMIASSPAHDVLPPSQLVIQGVMDSLTVMPVLASVAMPPPIPGFYAWWINETRRADAIPEIPLNRPSPTLAPWSLLYVGICPKRQSARTIEDRIQKDHRGSSIGASTFRFSMASLLRDSLGITPIREHGRVRITDEHSLSDWIDKHCALTFAQYDRPWVIEVDVIQALRPPLNLQHGIHEFRVAVSYQRHRLKGDCGL
jgi:hypothetical protein